MLGIAQERDDTFLHDKIVADFGCGPRGSLKWAKNARIKIGIDVLVERYFDLFHSDLSNHNMLYLKCSEKLIPISSKSIDILFTVNALDHVDNLKEICDELFRIIKPEGELIGSFNINEASAPCEPQMLTEELLEEHLLRRFDIQTYRISGGDSYTPYYENKLNYVPGERAHIWVRAIKRNTQVVKK